MGKQHNAVKEADFAPLDTEKEAKLRWIINNASTGKQAVIIDPDQGVVDSKPVELISPNENTNGVVRFRRHYAPPLLADKQRLVAEVRVMREKYGDRAVLRQRGHQLYWEYTVHESGRSFPVEIHYPDCYPAMPPRILSVKKLPHSPHQLGAGELCWVDFTNRQWSPARDTAAICVAASHRWFACLLCYLTTSEWPSGADD